MRGSVRQLVLFDIADEIQLDELQRKLGISPPEPIVFARPAPDYVRFERPPLVETLGEGIWRGRIKYFDYGVASVEFHQPFSVEWPELVEMSASRLSDNTVEQHALELLRPRLERGRSALVNPYKEWLDEDYLIITVQPEEPAAELLVKHGREIAQAVRGEVRPLSDAECQEVLSASLSYYPNDLVIVGWFAAFVYDTPEGAAPVLQLLEYANAQLLEFRHYDELLTQVLRNVYKSLARGTGFWRRWGLAGDAERLNRARLEITEIAERIETSIKFLSDMFYARMYRLAAARVGVTDYRRLVDHKLETAGELYRFMVDRFDQGRGFFLELVVIVILLVELVFLLWKP